MPYLFENDEHAALREQIRKFCRNEILPHVNGWEEAGEFPRELYKTAAETGQMGVGHPEEWGGAGGDLSHMAVAAEQIITSGQSPGLASGLGIHGIALPPILNFGSDAQRERFARPALSGSKIPALGITEAGGGSDVASLRTKAVRDGDYYVVNGSKMFITSGTRADFVVTAVRTGDEGHAGISLLIIESDTPGFEVSKKLDKMGWWASDTAELSFTDCRVPVANLIGEENAGFIAIMMNFVVERVLLCAQCLGIAELAYQESVKYARSRKAFGKNLMGFQITRHKLAEMRTRMAAARALTSEVVTRHVAGEQVAHQAAMAKNTATDMCSFVCDQAVQIHGGYGFMREYVVERLYRDARLYPIGGGTREIMNEIISKTEGY